MKYLTIVTYSFALLYCIESQIRNCPHSQPFGHPPTKQIYQREKDLQPEASNLNHEKTSSDSDEDFHDGWHGGNIHSGNWWDGWVKGWFSSVKKEELKKHGMLKDNRDEYKNHNNLGGHKPGHDHGRNFRHIGGYSYSRHDYGKYAPYKYPSYGKYAAYKSPFYGKYAPYKSASYGSYYYKHPYRYGNYGYKSYYSGYKPYSYGHYGRYHPYPVPYGHIYGYRG